MTDLHRCPRCNSGSWFVEREDKTVVVVCLLCGC
jgi:transcription elongation factor Elf1